MKKREFKTAALLGLAAGIVVAQQGLDAKEASVFVSEQYMVAKGCPQGKCPHLTAMGDAPSANVDTSYTDAMQKANEGNMNYKLMTEDELVLQLNDEGLKLYNSLTPEGKELTRFVASQMCQNTNACKGLNACATDKNACAGQGECKGQGKCGLADKNLAVKLVAKRMAEKRATANGTTQNAVKKQVK